MNAVIEGFFGSDNAYLEGLCGIIEGEYLNLMLFVNPLV